MLCHTPISILWLFHRDSIIIRIFFARMKYQPRNLHLLLNNSKLPVCLRDWDWPPWTKEWARQSEFRRLHTRRNPNHRRPLQFCSSRRTHSGQAWNPEAASPLCHLKIHRIKVPGLVGFPLGIAFRFGNLYENSLIQGFRGISNISNSLSEDRVGSG